MSKAESTSVGRNQNPLHRYVPITAWLPRYQRAWLPTDLLAGLAVWSLTVPQAMAYSSIAGVPPVYGLFCVPLAVLAYAIFGSSRTLSIGPGTGVAIIPAPTVGALAAQGSDEFLALTFAMAILVGVLYVIFGLLRLGWVADFLANPVLKGFMQGLALVVLVGQMPKMFGVEGGFRLTFAKAKDPVREMMRRTGAEEAIGAENFYGSVDEGVRAFLNREKDGL